jgi:2-aminoadipate transaminase
MPFDLSLSTIARRMRPSPIRELFKLIQRPGMISFAGGLPDPAIFPVDEFAASAEVLGTEGRAALQYGASEGYGPLLDVLRPWMTDHLGREIPADQLLVTTGSQQAADLLGRALIDPGDVVVVEAPTYPGTLHALRNVGARFACVPCDGDGMQVERLPEVVARVEAESGARPKLVYTIPDFANPTGACLSEPRRRRLLELTGELGIPLFEDDPYGCLRYRGEPIPPIARLADGAPHVLYASSFSKVLAPGIRVAWAVGTPALIRAMVLLRQGEDLCTPTATQAVVAEYCRRGHLERHLGRIVDHYRAKRDAMQRELVATLPTDRVHWHEPEGGFFFWLTLPGLDSDELFQAAVEAGIAFLPGGAFYPAPEEQVGEVQGGAEHARLCFTFADEAQIAEGCRRLVSALS